MRKYFKIIVSLVVILAIATSCMYRTFFDIQSIDGQQILQEVPSPSGSNTLIVYLNNGGATTDYAVLCAVKDNQSGRERNIYWQYHRSDASIQWLDDDTAVINGIELDVWKDSYDYRSID